MTNSAIEAHCMPGSVKMNNTSYICGNAQSPCSVFVLKVVLCDNLQAYYIDSDRMYCRGQHLFTEDIRDQRP